MSHPLHAGGNPQRSFHGAMLDIAEDRTYARSFSVSERVLNQARRITTEADAEQTAVGGDSRAELGLWIVHELWHTMCHYECICDNDLANCYGDCN